jgi:hypothetical protein
MAKLLNLYECAEQFQVPVKWLKQAAIAEKIPCLRLGKRDMRFDPEAVSDALARLAATEYSRKPTALEAS